MTINEFRVKHCSRCGTQRCLGEAEDLPYCGHYHGEIEGIEKVKSFMEIFEEEMAKQGITWDDLRKRVKDVCTGIDEY